MPDALVMQRLEQGIEAIVGLGDRIDACLDDLVELDVAVAEPDGLLLELSTLTADRHRLMETLLASLQGSLLPSDAQLLEAELRRVNQQVSLLEKHRCELQHQLGGSRRHFQAASTYLDNQAQ